LRDLNLSKFVIGECLLRKKKRKHFNLKREKEMCSQIDAFEEDVQSYGNVFEQIRESIEDLFIN
jgi:hypothetical protein